MMPVPALFETFTPYPFVLERGRGDRVWDTEGREYIDFYGGHCVCLTGHCHPRVVQAIQRQAETLLFYSTAATLAIRDRAAEALIAFAGPAFASVFFCNSGAEANENALKIALKLTGRRRLASVEGGWHGRTGLCLSVTDDPPITEPYAEVLPASLRLPLNDIGALESADFTDAAGVIVEPVQSMAGIRVADREWLAALRAKCDAHGTLLIFDEIQTGMGRLGAPFVGSVGPSPDMITSAKGLASGVPMGAVLMSESVARQLSPKDLGSTFGGGPIACAALLATLEVIQEEDLMARALQMEAAIRTALPVAQAPVGKGLLLGVPCANAPHAKSALQDRGILVGSSRDPGLIRLMPPLTVSEGSVEALGTALTAITEVPA